MEDNPLDKGPLEQRVRQLEELVTHHEHVAEQLNQVVVRMRGELTRLEAKVDEQVARLTWKVEQPPEIRDPVDEKPPHY